MDGVEFAQCRASIIFYRLCMSLSAITLKAIELNRLCYVSYTVRFFGVRAAVTAGCVKEWTGDIVWFVERPNCRLLSPFLAALCKARFPFKRNRLRARALRKRKPQETQALALVSSQSWLPLLWTSIPIGWRLRLLRENFKRLRFLRFSFTQRTQRKRLRLNGNRA